MITEDKYETTAEPNRPKRKMDDRIDSFLVVILVGLFLAIIVIFFVDFIFNLDVSIAEISLDAAIITVCTTMIYIVSCSYTIRKGRKTDKWREKRERLESTYAGLVDENYVKYAAAYCRELEEAHLRERQKIVLAAAGIILEDFKNDYCKYTAKELQSKFPDLTAQQRRAIGKANRLRGVHYNESYLTASVKVSRNPDKLALGGVSMETVQTVHNVRTIITTVATSMVTATLFRDILFNFSWEAVVECIVKVAITAVFAGYGMIWGYNFATVREVGDMETRIAEMTTFKKWCEGHEDKSIGKDKTAA